MLRFARTALTTGLRQLSFLLLSAVATVAQPLLIVDDDGQGSAMSCDAPGVAFATIAAAMIAAPAGATVRVCPGTYVENLTFDTKVITVRSAAGPGATIIDGNAAGSVVTFAAATGPGSTLDGFTIRNGIAGSGSPGDGGGIRIVESSPVVRNNVIVDNRGCSGAGISIQSGSPLIKGNRIAGNVQAGCTGGTGGGGIGIVGLGAAGIVENVIVSNTMTSASGGGISLFAAGFTTIQRNIIALNSVSGISPCAQGGGISIVNQSDATIRDNLIFGNAAGCGGGVYWLVPSGARGPLLANNTIVANPSPLGSGIFADGFDVQAVLVNNVVVASSGQVGLYCGNFNDTNPPVIRFNNVFSPTGMAYGGICADQTGANQNISADPQFVNPAADNYHLRRTSPGVDAGDNTAVSLLVPILDFDGDFRIIDGDAAGGAVVDMGADEYNWQDLALDFGTPYGVWMLERLTTWRPIHGSDTEAMVAGDRDGNGVDDLVLDFGPANGVWAWMNHTTWSQLTTFLDPTEMVAGDLDADGRDEVVLALNGGLQVIPWNGAVLTYAVGAGHVAVGNLDGSGGDEVVTNNRYAQNQDHGVWILRNGLWAQLHQLSASAIAIADLDGNGQDDIVLDFPGFGLWIYSNDSTWVPLHGLSASRLAAGDLDLDGQEDLIIDFGPPHGLWIYSMASGWRPLHGMSAQALAVADLDGGAADVIVDFGTAGVWAFKNNSMWQPLHGFDPQAMAAGRLH